MFYSLVFHLKCHFSITALVFRQKCDRLYFCLKEYFDEVTEMKRNLKAILSMLLALCLLTACAGTPAAQPSGTDSGQTSGAQPANPPAEGAQDPAAPAYPLEGSPKLTMAIKENNTLSQVTPNHNDAPIFKEMQARTGVEIEWVFTPDFSVLFASGDYPDMIAYDFNSYPGKFTKAIDDGIIEPLNDYLDTCAPDYKAVLQSNDDWWRSITSIDGQVGGFAFIRGDEYLQTYRGLFMRNDWLKKLDLEVPQTPDELRNVLMAFKTELGAAAPFATTWGNLRDRGIGAGIFTTPFGLVKGDLYQLDGKVHYGYYEPEMKDVLAYLNGLFNDGLLTSELATIKDDVINADMMGENTGLNIGTSGTVGNYLDAMTPTNPDYDITGLSSLVAKRGDTAFSCQYDYAIAGFVIAISASSKNKETAAKYLNYHYTEEGRMLNNWGVEGVSYEMVDGKPKYTEAVINFDGGMRLGINQYCNATKSYAFVQDPLYQDEYMPYECQTQTYRAWAANADPAKYAIPNVLEIPAEYVNEYSKLSSDITTYVKETTLKFITGVEPLSNFDTYLSTLKDMGVERYIELTQIAYDAYRSK